MDVSHNFQPYVLSHFLKTRHDCYTICIITSLITTQWLESEEAGCFTTALKCPENLERLTSQDSQDVHWCYYIIWCNFINLETSQRVLRDKYTKMLIK